MQHMIREGGIGFGPWFDVFELIYQNKLTILHKFFLFIYNETHVECPLVSLQFIDQSYVELTNVPKHFSNFSWAFLTNNFFSLA